jgi:hypothetical protein
LAAGDCLIHTLDVLAILAISTSHIVRNEAKDMLTEFMSKIDDLELMKNHKVDPLKSPLMMAPKKQYLNEINTSVYYEYPQPWYAAMYDMCHYLEKMHLTTSDPVLFPSLSIDF